ncbi:site-specific DNA-methyltransferase [Corynebacterium casei]|uniref:site-specific DNA-methyltransferase n=1 Tax=Corynebacterium casei TaxID=160386 RepID=UPI003FD00712
MNDDINHIPSNTPDFQTELAERLAELAPEAIADGKIDVEKLKELLDGDADESNERFGLLWPGKKRALRVAQQPTTATLKPDAKNSKDWDTTKNVFIEGDNLEVLKVLQKHYHGKIKMIYIDPPYNTGKDFVYPDNFKEGLDTYLEWTKQVNEEGQRLSSNSESEGRYHSNWLNMMYPRLKLARNLLTDDGLIFISIDDHEAPNLRKLCDEIFGEQNFAGQLIWKKGGTGKNDSQFAVVEHEYVVVYAKRAAKAGFSADAEAKVTTSYNREDERGKYSLVRLDSKTLGYVASLDYPILGNDGHEYFPEQPEGKSKVARWRWGKDKVAAERAALVFENGFVYTKNYQREGARPRSLMSEERFGVTRTGRAEAEAAIGQKGVFNFPKPVRLIQHLVRIGADSEAIVLDFFAGSATTAQAVMAQNALDGGTRKFIMVQLPEPTPDSSDARLAGFKHISEISRARITGAAKNLSDEGPKPDYTGAIPLDLGFRTFTLTDSNFAKWQVSSDTPVYALEQHLLELRESANDNATPADLFVELLLKQGYSLTEEIGDMSIAGLDLKAVFDSDGDVAVLAYLDEHSKPTLNQLREIADSKPVRFVILEDCFRGDDELKTNLVQICKTSGVELWTA